ncbi:hypothetical protein Zmor_019423 [Zophobas morio]|uniref:BPTI/Kunitz inhibitor domain-containing protein n=1 Tax=Zophobas morio TaxID=2755281 RepID=A0AA38I1Q4_9CUCU|nr:hypothetical protein Zmor_019423 [Zophobas morio]
MLVVILLLVASLKIVYVDPRRRPSKFGFRFLEIEDPEIICDLPEDPGPCKSTRIRWNYDSFTGNCYMFKYGGCYGNENNFLSYQQCMHKCYGVRMVNPDYVDENGSEQAEVNTDDVFENGDEQPEVNTDDVFEYGDEEPEVNTDDVFEYGDEEPEVNTDDVFEYRDEQPEVNTDDVVENGSEQPKVNTNGFVVYASGSRNPYLEQMTRAQKWINSNKFFR